MKPLDLLGPGAALASMLTTGPAQAQQRTAATGPRITYPSQSNHFSWERGHGFKRGFGGFLIVEREVPVYIEKETAPPKAVPLPTPSAQGGEKERKPYVVGSTYASLPASCMKLIEQGASYYFCGGGEWYREVRAGRDPLYRAVSRKL
jgi:hypothetical protein